MGAYKSYLLEQMGDDEEAYYDDYGGSLDMDEADEDLTEEQLEAMREADYWESRIFDAEEKYEEERADRLNAWGPMVRALAATLGLTLSDDAVETFLSSCKIYDLTKDGPKKWSMQWHGSDVDMSIDHREGVDEKMQSVLPSFSAFFNAMEWNLIDAQAA